MRPRGVALQTALRVQKDEDTNIKFLYLANFCIGGSLVAMNKTDDNFIWPSCYQTFLLSP
jgi:hypothetical protein